MAGGQVRGVWAGGATCLGGRSGVGGAPPEHFQESGTFITILTVFRLSALGELYKQGRRLPSGCIFDDVWAMSCATVEKRASMAHAEIMHRALRMRGTGTNPWSKTMSLHSKTQTTNRGMCFCIREEETCKPTTHAGVETERQFGV